MVNDMKNLEKVTCVCSVPQKASFSLRRVYKTLNQVKSKSTSVSIADILLEVFLFFDIPLSDWAQSYSREQVTFLYPALVSHLFTLSYLNLYNTSMAIPRN